MRGVSLQGINADLQNLLAKLHSRPQLSILPANGQAVLSGPAAAAGFHGGSGALLPYQHGPDAAAVAALGGGGGGLQVQQYGVGAAAAACGDDKSHQQAEEVVRSAWQEAKGMVGQCREQQQQEQQGGSGASLAAAAAGGGGGGGRGDDGNGGQGSLQAGGRTGGRHAAAAMVAGAGGEGGDRRLVATGSGGKSLGDSQHRAFVDDLVSKAVGLLLTLQKCTKPSQQPQQGGEGVLSTCVACDALTRAVLNNRASGENLELYKRVLDSVQILKGQLARVC